MLNDTERGRAFESALASQIQPHHVVLDIGTGSGLLAMMAARAGAKRVITCERNPVIAALAEKVIAANNLDDVIEVHRVASDELDAEYLGGPADIIVTETFDCGLLGEGVLPTLRHARRHLLAPDGILVPAAARVTAMLIDSQAVWTLNTVSTSGGFDVSDFNALATRGYFPVRLATYPYTGLSQPVDVFELDLRHDALDPWGGVLEFPVTREGTCHGVAFWFELLLSPTERIRTSPQNSSSHWHQAVQCFPDPFPVVEGDTVRLAVRRDDSTVCFEPPGRRPQQHIVRFPTPAAMVAGSRADNRKERALHGHGSSRL